MGRRALHRPTSVLLDDAVVELRARLLDDVAVVVDELALLPLDELVEELDEHAVGRQELDLLALPLYAEDLGHEVGRHLRRLRGEHAERELAQLGRRVVEQKVGEDLGLVGW